MALGGSEEQFVCVMNYRLIILQEQQATDYTSIIVQMLHDNEKSPKVSASPWSSPCRKKPSLVCVRYKVSPS